MSTMQADDKGEGTIILTGDWHIDTNKPENRTDNFFLTQFEKINCIFTHAHEQGAKVILQPGDFFNSHRANYFLEQHYIRLLKTWSSIPIFTVFGQHDLRYHSSDRLNTPLSVLEAAKVVTILGSEPTKYDEALGFPGLIYGASWGEEIPEIDKTAPPHTTHILVIHRMILNNKKLFEDQQDYTWGNQLLKTTDFDLIVSGDNHEQFVIREGNRWLVNAGSLMRTRIDQVNHIPKAYVYDSVARTVEELPLPIKPTHEVLNLQKAEKEKERNEELESFVKILSEGPKIEGLNFKRNLWSKVRSGKIEKGVVEILEEVMV